jgi:hypothetical protein
MARKAAKSATPAPSRTALVIKAFGSGKKGKSIDAVVESLAKAGVELTEKQVRSALDRARVQGRKVEMTDRRTFAVH